MTNRWFWLLLLNRAKKKLQKAAKICAYKDAQEATKQARKA
jgi:hypothetical protein